MDPTLTLPLLPNPPIPNTSNEILMAEALPRTHSYKEITMGKIIPPTSIIESEVFGKDKDMGTIYRGILPLELRGRYARIFIQIPLDTSVAASISINTTPSLLSTKERAFYVRIVAF